MQFLVSTLGQIQDFLEAVNAHRGCQPFIFDDSVHIVVCTLDTPMKNIYYKVLPRYIRFTYDEG